MGGQNQSKYKIVCPLFLPKWIQIIQKLFSVMFKPMSFNLVNGSIFLLPFFFFYLFNGIKCGLIFPTIWLKIKRKERNHLVWIHCIGQHLFAVTAETCRVLGSVSNTLICNNIYNLVELLCSNNIAKTNLIRQEAKSNEAFTDDTQKTY